MEKSVAQNSLAKTRSAHRLQYAATAIGVLVSLVGAGHLVAWHSGYMAQRGVSSITMKTNTALVLLLLGVALVLLIPAQARAARRWVGRACAAVALLVGAMSLSENLIGWNLGIDQLLAQEPPGAAGVTAPNRMGVPASMSFTLAGAAIFILSRRDFRWLRTANVLAVGVCLISLLGTIGYLYGAQSFYAVAHLTGIAWPTAASLLMLGLGLLLARPTGGLMAQVTADDPGGANLRRWLPVLLLPVVLGWLRLVGERLGVFDAATGTAMMMIVFIVALSILAYTGARRVSRSSAALRQTVEELARSNKELEQFAYVASHDLQEPLRQVRAYVQMLQERHADKLDGKAAQYFKFVCEGATRMSDLVQGLLEYSRAGAPGARRQPAHCQQAFDAAVANLQAGIAESRASITHDELPIVTADPTRLTQLFQNLLGNAVKFRREGMDPQVHVGCRRESDHWLFWVKDNGIGIAPEQFERIFVIFQRLHGPDKYPGTGIGLSICKKIVERHGGRIWVESQPGEGATFFFTLPEEPAAS